MIDFNKIPEQGWKLNFVMPYGKYKGITLEEIGETDADYLDWLNSCEGVNLHSEVREILFRPLNTVSSFKSYTSSRDKQDSADGYFDDTFDDLEPDLPF